MIYLCVPSTWPSMGVTAGNQYVQKESMPLVIVIRLSTEQ